MNDEFKYMERIQELAELKNTLQETTKKKKEHFNKYHKLMREEKKLRKELMDLIPNKF